MIDARAAEEDQIIGSQLKEKKRPQAGGGIIGGIFLKGGVKGR